MSFHFSKMFHLFNKRLQKKLKEIQFNFKSQEHLRTSMDVINFILCNAKMQKVQHESCSAVSFK